MRRLSLTLMLVVVLSIVGAGWAVDRLFAVLDARSSDAIQTAEQLGNRLVDLLDGSSQAELDSLASIDSSEHEIYTIARDSIVLPATLEKQLESRLAVALESVEGVSLHFLLPTSQRVLVLRIPTPESSATPLRLMLTLTFYLASEDLLRMEQLVNVLLEFARLEQKLEDLPLQSVSLRLIVEQAKEAVTHTSKRRVEVDEVGTGVSILADERYTLMLVNNLLQNAVKFSDSVVRVTISSQAERVFLHIEDDGPGFNIGDTERLLKPFQKGVSEHGAQSTAAGYGLGLAIVERIARWQGAAITLGNSVDLKGACVIVDFEAV